MQVAYDHRHLANVSAKCKSLSAIWRTSPQNARAFPPFGERLREMQEPFHHLANVSCNLRETFVPLQTSPATCGRLSYPYIPSPTTCGKLSYPYKHLLQLAGDLRTPTNISCNLRETFVPLQTSPAICGRLSYPYIPSPAICGRPSYPYEKVLQHFFRLRFVLLIESPTFVSLKYNTQKR